MELRNKVVRLDERVFGVQQPAVGPFQRRLQETGGITPLVFGQYGELSASFEALIDTLAIKGCDRESRKFCSGPCLVAAELSTALEAITGSQPGACREPNKLAGR